MESTWYSAGKKKNPAHIGNLTPTFSSKLTIRFMNISSIYHIDSNKNKLNVELLDKL
jgi:hypothetical protein